jgi:hypothetical protein
VTRVGEEFGVPPRIDGIVEDVGRDMIEYARLVASEDANDDRHVVRHLVLS